MAKYFSGTSTGNKYEVGRDYVTGDGRVMTAQADGSFEKKGNLVGYTDQGKAVVDDVGRGSQSRGSYGNPDVDWYASGRDAADYRAAGSSSPAARAAMGGDSYDGPDGTAVRVPAPIATQGNRGAFLNAAFNNTPANRGAFMRDISTWSGKDDPAQDILMGGYHMRANPRWSNGEVIEMRYGDNELISTLYGLSVLGADFGYNARIAWDNGGSRAVQDALSRAPQAALETGLSWREGINAWASEHNAQAERVRQIEADLNDALDYRMELTRTEALKGGDWTAIPGITDSWQTRPKNEFSWGAPKTETYNPATGAWY